MAYKMKKPTMREYLKTKRVSWNTLYNNYGVKEVNKKIESGKVYSSMDGKPRYLGV